ncbi:MAG: site-specific integrase [Prevotellaceae bacterium]|jgi:integrase|nr:site-specific integrase [Prevotellaceae bacterium]
MATFKYEIQNKRADGTYNVRIRITSNREIRRLSTNIYVTDADLTRKGKIKNQNIIDKCEDLLRRCREACTELGFGITGIPIDRLVEKIKTHLEGKKEFQLDFILYTQQKTAEMSDGTAQIYKGMISALKRHIKRDSLNINEITSTFLKGFEKFLESEPNQQGNRTKKSESGRKVSAYLSCLRAMHNKAKDEYNDEDTGLIRIPYSPFKNFKVKAQPLTRKRALSTELIQEIINLPYEKEKTGGKWNRFNLAKDCFLLSFALIGMNSADMYSAGKAKDSIITYNRKKTTTRRHDNAEMKVMIEPCISNLIDKYKDKDGKKLFDFHNHYSDMKAFNKALNKGLKQIGKKLEIDDLEFYAARHSWATIARSAAVGIDKYTVHEALNHSDKQMKITDVYIERDWMVIWNANKKVLALFDF